MQTCNLYSKLNIENCSNIVRELSEIKLIKRQTCTKQLIIIAANHIDNLANGFFAKKSHAALELF